MDTVRAGHVGVFFDSGEDGGNGLGVVAFGVEEFRAFESDALEGEIAKFIEEICHDALDSAFNVFSEVVDHRDEDMDGEGLLDLLNEEFLDEM